MELILATALGCLITFVAYRQGIKDGQQLKRDQSIKPIVKSPVKVYKEAKEAKEVEVFDQGITNLMAYDGTEQK
jgi:hypothetical protein